ncbi:hypothetical protein Trydic_g11538, partial [Trypoxylus dichotomus]
EAAELRASCEKKSNSNLDNDRKSRKSVLTVDIGQYENEELGNKMGDIIE